MKFSPNNAMDCVNIATEHTHAPCHRFDHSRISSHIHILCHVETPHHVHDDLHCDHNASRVHSRNESLQQQPQIHLHTLYLYHQLSHQIHLRNRRQLILTFNYYHNSGHSSIQTLTQQPPHGVVIHTHTHI